MTVADFGRYRVICPGTVADNGFLDYIDVGPFPESMAAGDHRVKVIDADHADVEMDGRWLRLKIEHGDPIRITPPDAPTP